jgi:hypothetical protein
MLADFTGLQGVVSQNKILFKNNLYSVKSFFVVYYLCEEQNATLFSMISTMLIRFARINLYLKFGRQDKLLIRNYKGRFGK